MDDELRRLERAWRASGTKEDEAAWLRARERAGELSRATLERAAAMGFDWIFVNPIQPTGRSGSLYSISDYFGVNPALLAPGIYDALSARIAVQAGFPAVFVSGFGVAASRLGMPDTGLISFGEMFDSFNMVRGAAPQTLVLAFGAVGTLVGQPNKGLMAMFVMMNAARLGVGNQGLGQTEVAYQNALAYAKERLQMRSLSGPKAPDQPADPIIVHPDVRKMLLTAKAYAEGGRALAMQCALLLDKARHHPDAAVRQDSEDMVALLTPIVKAFLTDNGVTATNACMQVYGGHGYIHETGAEQFVRDARINPIYEGTNTVQALDLLGRKVLANQGATLRKLGQQVAALLKEESANPRMAEFTAPLAALAGQLSQFSTEIGVKASGGVRTAEDALRMANDDEKETWRTWKPNPSDDNGQPANATTQQRGSQSRKQGSNGLLD